MNNPATILSFLGSVAVVLIIAVLYFLTPSPKPPILRILLIFFIVATVLGVLAGIIVPLIKNKNMTTKDNELKMIFNQIDDFTKIQSLTKEKVEKFFKIKLTRSDEPDDSGFDIYNAGSINDYPFTLVQLYQSTIKSEAKEGFLNLTVSQKLNISEQDVKNYFGKPQFDSDNSEAVGRFWGNLTYINQLGRLNFNFQRDNNKLEIVVIDRSR